VLRSIYAVLGAGGAELVVGSRDGGSGHDSYRICDLQFGVLWRPTKSLDAMGSWTSRIYARELRWCQRDSRSGELPFQRSHRVIFAVHAGMLLWLAWDFTGANSWRRGLGHYFSILGGRRFAKLSARV